MLLHSAPTAEKSVPREWFNTSLTRTATQGRQSWPLSAMVHLLGRKARVMFKLISEMSHWSEDVRCKFEGACTGI